MADRVLGRLVAVIDGDLSGLQQALNGAQKSLQGAGQTLTSAGRSLSLGLTAPLVALGGVALKSSIDFESAFAGVRKTVDATEEQFANLRQEIRDMAKEVPASASEIAAVAEAGGQLGIATENLMEFTRVMIDLGETTNLTADEAATAFAQIANVMQLPQDQFDEMGSALVDLGNKGASTEADIVEMAKRIAGAGATIGMSTQDVLGLAAGLANVGIEAEAGGSAISRTMITIASAVADGGSDLEDFAAVAGQSAEDFAQLFGDEPAMAIVSFIEGLSRMNDEGVNVFGTLKDLELGEIRVRDALLRGANAGDIFREQLIISNEAWGENVALTKEAEQRYGTTASKLEIARNKLNDVAITLGDALAPALLTVLERSEPMIEFLAKMAEKFADLDPTIQTIIIGFAGFAAIMGPTLIILGQLAFAIKALLPIVGLLVVAAPWIALGLAIVAAAAAIYIFRDDIKQGLTEAWDFIKENAAELGTALLPIISAPFAPIVALATDAFGIRSALEGAFEDISGIDFSTDIESAFTSVKETLDGLKTDIEGFPETVKTAFTGGEEAVVGFTEDVATALETHFTPENVGRGLAWFAFYPQFLFLEAFKQVRPVVQHFATVMLPQFFLETLPSLSSTIGQFGKDIINALTEGMREAFPHVKTFFTESISTFINETAPNAIAQFAVFGFELMKSIGSGALTALHIISALPFAIWITLWTGIREFGDEFFAIGKSIMSGIWEGMKDLMPSIAEGFVEFLGGFVGEAWKKIQGNSPSKVFMEIGNSIMDGLAIGIDKRAENALQSLDQVMTDIVASGSMLHLDTGQMAMLSPAMAGGVPSFGRSMFGDSLAPRANEGAAGGFTFVSNGPITVNEFESRDLEDIAFGVQAVATRALRSRGVMTA